MLRSMVIRRIFVLLATFAFAATPAAADPFGREWIGHNPMEKLSDGGNIFESFGWDKATFYDAELNSKYWGKVRSVSDELLGFVFVLDFNNPAKSYRARYFLRGNYLVMASVENRTQTVCEAHQPGLYGQSHQKGEWTCYNVVGVFPNGLSAGDADIYNKVTKELSRAHLDNMPTYSCMDLAKTVRDELACKGIYH